MATFEGPLLSIRAVNAISHYTDWTIGHVHSGALGWNGFMAAAMFYWLAPRLWKTKLWSTSLANMHFWIGLVGILIYVAAMWIAGISQALMLNEVDATGTTLKYEYVETLKSIHIEYALRSFGGFLYLVGFILCGINIWMTARSGVATNDSVEVAALPREKKDFMKWSESLVNDPLAYIFIGIILVCLWFFLPPFGNWCALIAAILLSIKAVMAFRANSAKWANWHERLVENYLPFTLLVFVAVAIGGALQIIPSLVINRDKNIEGRLQELYTPLELAGRDIYVSEGCYNCHSQMIRTLKPDVMRYGRTGIADDYSHLGESIYDHPYQWGSKRTGPDLAREGGPIAQGAKHMRIGKRDNVWHFNHFLNPRSISEDSNMPNYPWLFETKTNFKALPKKIAVQQKIGVPWPAMSKDEIEQNAREQAMEIATNLVQGGVYLEAKPDLKGDELRNYLAEQEVIALIAYMQKLGAYREVKPEGGVQPSPLDPDSFRKTAMPIEAPSATVNPR
jgi:cytochrome c oxidase cbb3-type subunit I/II